MAVCSVQGEGTIIRERSEGRPSTVDEPLRVGAPLIACGAPNRPLPLGCAQEARYDAGQGVHIERVGVSPAKSVPHEEERPTHNHGVQGDEQSARENAAKAAASRRDHDICRPIDLLPHVLTLSFRLCVEAGRPAFSIATSVVTRLDRRTRSYLPIERTFSAVRDSSVMRGSGRQRFP